MNLSAANLYDAGLPEFIGALLARSELAPGRLMVEITESGIMVAQADRTVRRLSEMGVGVSIDDFGTGYSALSYLKALPVDEIKIDRSFVRDMAVNPDDAAIVQPTIDLGHNLRLRVTAEGVEDEDLVDAGSPGLRRRAGLLHQSPDARGWSDGVDAHFGVGRGATRSREQHFGAERDRDGVNPTLLVVDDDLPLLRVLALHFENEGYDVQTAGSGREALAKVALRKPAVIVLDGTMPELSGADTCRQVRQMTTGRDIGILILTANDGLEAEVREAGADGFMTKPFSLVDLEAEVRRLTSNSLNAVDPP